MLNTMSVVKYLLAAASVFLLGTAAGIFVNHAKSGIAYSIPVALGIGGLFAASIAWRLHKAEGRLRK